MPGAVFRSQSGGGRADPQPRAKASPGTKEDQVAILRTRGAQGWGGALSASEVLQNMACPEQQGTGGKRHVQAD